MRRIAVLGLLAGLLLAARADAITLEPVGSFTNPIFVTSWESEFGLRFERSTHLRLAMASRAGPPIHP